MSARAGDWWVNPSFFANVKPVRIVSWRLVHSEAGPFTAPELRTSHLRGQVFGHPRKPDGLLVTTSAIVSVEGRLVQTTNNLYELFEPSSDYLVWLQEQGLKLDAENPIKLKGAS